MSADLYYLPDYGRPIAVRAGQDFAGQARAMILASGYPTAERGQVNAIAATLVRFAAERTEKERRRKT